MASWLRKPVPAALILVLLWSIWRLVVLWHTGIPQPLFEDEYSYLLGADTFAHGRLANPPPALGKFFESPHELVRPTYASKYPPGQAMFLALGQTMFGVPFYGVLIGNALMLFAFCLMLFAWVPPPWALAWSATFGLYFSPDMYWTNSYLGGSVAASGGALVLLAVGIYRRRQTPFAGVIFSIGTLLLFWTRPYEGGIFTLVVLAVFAGEIWRKRRASVLIAASLVFAVGGAWTCWDDEAVTGNAFRLPYVLHQKQYDVAPVLWFLPLRSGLTYSHSRLAALHGTNGQEPDEYRQEGPRWQSIAIGLIDTLKAVSWKLNRMLLVALILVPVAWRDPLFRKMAIIAGICLLSLSVETFHKEHYTAPVWGALVLLLAIWARHAWNLRIYRLRAGIPLVLLTLVSPPMSFGLMTHVVQYVRGTSSNSNMRNATVPDNWPDRRAQLIRHLSSLDQRQIVMVRYPSPSWRIWEEWVYNSADIDQQRVIFAHDLGWEENRVLLGHYAGRAVSLLTFDSASGQEKIEPYPRDLMQP